MRRMRAVTLGNTITDGRTARRTATRNAILSAATTLFASKGVTATSIDDIAELAGTAKGSVFYNFGSKAGLVSDLFDSYTDKLRDTVTDSIGDKHGKDLRAAVVRALLLELREQPEAARVVVSELFRTDREWAEAVRRWRETAFGPIVADYVAEFGAEAEDRGHLLAASILGSTVTAALEWLVYRPTAELDAIEAVLLDVLQLS